MVECRSVVVMEFVVPQKYLAVMLVKWWPVTVEQVLRSLSLAIVESDRRPRYLLC